MRAIRDDDHGIELTTIHRAKGRQWPRVEVFAFEENQLPHHHAFSATDEEKAAGEGIEAERRLAYVAFTRAQVALVVSATESAASRFLTEAGLIEGIGDAERAAVLRAAGIRDGRTLLIRLDAGARPRFVRALRNLGEGAGAR